MTMESAQIARQSCLGQKERERDMSSYSRYMSYCFLRLKVGRREKSLDDETQREMA